MIHLHGWVAVNKALHTTSNQIVQRIRRSVKPLKVGHGGTLDALATGILPIAIGEATKTLSYVMDCDKDYEFEVTWGEGRDTDDSEGNIVACSEVLPSEDQILAILPKFIGEISQRPPLYSAVKIQGKRASDRARAREEVTLSERKITIYHLDLIESPAPRRTRFKMTCSKGTYVRSLARDMAKALGTVGYASAIHRSRVGIFTKENAIPQEKLANETQIGLIEGCIVSIPTVLDDISAVEVEAINAQKLYQGNKIPLSSLKRLRGQFVEEETVLCLTESASPLALARVKGQYLCPQRVFNIKGK